MVNGSIACATLALDPHVHLCGGAGISCLPGPYLVQCLLPVCQCNNAHARMLGHLTAHCGMRLTCRPVVCLHVCTYSICSVTIDPSLPKAVATKFNPPPALRSIQQNSDPKEHTLGDDTKPTATAAATATNDTPTDSKTLGSSSSSSMDTTSSGRSQDADAVTRVSSQDSSSSGSQLSAIFPATKTSATTVVTTGAESCEYLLSSCMLNFWMTTPVRMPVLQL